MDERQYLRRARWRKLRKAKRSAAANRSHYHPRCLAAKLNPPVTVLANRPEKGTGTV